MTTRGRAALLLGLLAGLAAGCARLETAEALLALMRPHLE